MQDPRMKTSTWVLKDASDTVGGEFILFKGMQVPMMPNGIAIDRVESDQYQDKFYNKDGVLTFVSGRDSTWMMLHRDILDRLTLEEFVSFNETRKAAVDHVEALARDEAEKAYPLSKTEGHLPYGFVPVGTGMQPSPHQKRKEPTKKIDPQTGHEYL